MKRSPLPKRRTPLARSSKPIRKRRKIRDHERGQVFSYPNGPGGREVCLPNAAGNAEYKRRTEEMWSRQNRLCAICGKLMYYPTFDHENGRGGGKRDDRIEVDGLRQNAAVHEWCNSRKGSRRIPYLLQ